MIGENTKCVSKIMNLDYEKDWPFTFLQLGMRTDSQYLLRW